jgi:hypothetical protein
MLQATFASLTDHRLNKRQRYLADTPLHRTIVGAVVKLMKGDHMRMKMEYELTSRFDSGRDVLDGPPLAKRNEQFWSEDMRHITWEAEYPLENKIREICNAY